MLVTLPDHIPALERMSEQELKRELAVALYAARKLTLVQAVDVADTSLFEFQALLRDRRIPQHYDEADLEQDLIALRELPPQ
jgi:predicted HTH domain antitoxin